MSEQLGDSAHAHAGVSGTSTAPTGAVPSSSFEPLPTPRVGIKFKLIGLMVAMTIVVVGPLATYAPAQQIAELRTASHDRAHVYAALASHQLGSAVTFEDRETAREVLDAIARDPLIDGIAVYDGFGKELQAQGTRSELALRAGQGISDRPVAYYLPGRILATAPIKSLEGARGTVVLELSTRGAHATQRHLILVAILVGGGALLLGGMMAWSIARSLATRIENLAAAASAMSTGDLAHAVDVGGPEDELGLLSHAFNAMSQKVVALVDHIQRTAREESVRLGRMVAQRTAELDAKNRDLRLVLDNVEQGFVTIDRDARPVGESSRAVDAWLGEPDAAGTLWSQLTRNEPRERPAFDAAWDQVVSEILPLEATLDQMPRRLVLAGRHLTLDYRPLGGEGFDRMLVVITDVTAVVARERSEQGSHELVNLATRLLKDRDGFLEFFGEAQRLLDCIAANHADPARLKRDLHTLKGNAALFGLNRISALCHDLETALEAQQPEELDRSALLECWGQCSAISKRLLGERQPGTIEIPEAAYTAVVDAVHRDAPKVDLDRMLRAWLLEPLRTRLERAADQLVATAARIGKGSVAVQVSAAEVYLGRQELGAFWAAFSHVVSNAAIHGLESSELRQQAGKSGGPNFGLRAGIEGERLFVEIADTGPGIDWVGIRARAKARGLPHATQEQLEDALFADGISTRDELTELAGRGVGLSAVRAECMLKHGDVRVTTKRGAGTSFHFSWPVSQFQTLVQLDAGGRSA